MREEIYYSLPYRVRRFLFKTLHRKEFQDIQKDRLIESDDDYTLKPFDQHKCIFVHIPKTAGVSVCLSLFHNLAGSHQPITFYQHVYSKKTFDSYFKFTFVRNPWSRLFSAYNYLKEGGMNDHDKKWAATNISEFTSFDDFVMRWLTPTNINNGIHFLPQYRFLCLPNRDEPLVDFIGYFENLQEDFAHITHQLSLGQDLAIRHENKSSSNSMQVDYRDCFTNKTRDIVSKVYKKDIEMFGYNFDNSSLAKQLADR